MLGGVGTRRSSALYLAAWGLLGVLLAGLMHTTLAASWGASLLFTLPLTLVYGCASGFSSYYLCRAYPLAARPLGAVLAVFGASAVSVSALWSAAASVWQAVLHDAGVGLPALPRPMSALLFGLGVILYGMMAVAHYLAREFERTRQLEQREMDMKFSAQEAQLRMLRTQIDPHFLFNSLNSISALTAIDPAAARDMTLQLSHFFRHSLGLDAQRLVALEQELALVRAFLAIEQVRFGSRLRFEEQVTAPAGACLLPPLLLQPLIENAVKHGIGNRIDGGLIRLHAELRAGQLAIRVENDADPDLVTPAAQGCGIGLVNVRERLLATYAHQASVHWGRHDERFCVDLLLPAATAVNATTEPSACA